MEPEWMKKISSETVCNFFYVFFVAYAVLAALMILTLVAGLTVMKKAGGLGVLVGIQGLITFGIATVFMLFYYIICDRALLAGKATKEQQVY